MFTGEIIYIHRIADIVLLLQTLTAELLLQLFSSCERLICITIIMEAELEITIYNLTSNLVIKYLSETLHKISRDLKSLLTL
jgi:hypothetical protein